MDNINSLKKKYPYLNIIYNQKGGEINKPSGGFPPLVKCDKNEHHDKSFNTINKLIEQENKIKMRGIESI